MDITKTLEQFCAIPGPSGYEREVALAAVEAMKPYADKAYLDRYGNAVAYRLTGKPEAKRILLDAHLDEIGLMVTGVEEGFLRFRTIGGVDPRILPNLEVLLLTDPPIPGVIATLPPHVQKAGEQNEAAKIEDLWIDVGMSQEEAQSRIPVGTPAVYTSDFTPLQGDFLAGKSMDDRAGFVSLLYTLALLKDKTLDVDLYVMGSTREEVSGAGAAVGTFAFAPHCCIAVDVTHGRVPDAPKDDTFLLGKGPVIGIGPNMTRWMTARLIEKAEVLGFSWQPEVMAGNTGTNAWKMQVTREGVATAIVSIPLKYMHTPYEVLKRQDVEDTARLLADFIQNLGEEGRWQR